MVYEVEQRMGILITSMVPAHYLHPVRSRSRNNHRNLGVGWCVSAWRPWFWPLYSIYYIHTIHYNWIRSNQKRFFKRHTYQKLVGPCWCVGWYDTVIISCLVSNVHFNLKGCFSYGLCRCWVSRCAPFAISLTEFYFIMIIRHLWLFFTFWTAC